MPIERLVDHERRLVEFVFHGAITKDEIIAHRREMDATEPETFGYDALVDARQGSLDLTILEIRDVANGAREERWPRSRCALVTCHDPAFTDFKLLELWGSRGPREYRVFRSLGEACAWLGVESAGLCSEHAARG
jgi:hypothetical protein